MTVTVILFLDGGERFKGLIFSGLSLFVEESQATNQAIYPVARHWLNDSGSSNKLLNHKSSSPLLGTVI